MAGPASPESEQKTQPADYFRQFEVSFGSSKKESWLSLCFWGLPRHFNAAMETRSKRRTTEPVIDKVRRGEISVVVALAEELPDLFEAEVLPKLDIWATLNLAQVSKSFNRAVWSVGGVRSMEAKMKAHFVETGIDCDAEPMVLAAESGNLPAVRALLESGWDVNRPMVTEGYRALHHAVGTGQMAGNVAVVKVLIEAGADVNMTTDIGWTPLHVAAVGTQREAVVKILIDAGADVNKANNEEWTPLHWAVLYRHGVTVGILIDAGADVNRATDDGYTPMSLALSVGDGNTVELLKQAGAIHGAE